jgi:uncharacterized membrane protein
MTPDQISTLNWAQAAPATASAFLASLVECIEALTIVLAVGAVRGWRSALTGAAAAVLLLLALVAIMGPALTRIPLAPVQLIVGGLGLVFGLRWLRKAIRRAAGTLKLRDENLAYARETARLRATASAGHSSPHRSWDPEAFWTCFRIAMLEGIEVVFIVIAIGATGRSLLGPASLGALGALALVAVLGVVLHRPVSNIPENTLKFAVGVMLGEGAHVKWPGGDASLAALVAAYLAAALLAVKTLKLGQSKRPPAIIP